MNEAMVKERIQQLGLNVRAYRMAQNLSQKRLALMIHTDQGVIARIESGQTNTSIGRYVQIADALGVPLSTLVDC